MCGDVWRCVEMWGDVCATSCDWRGSPSHSPALPTPPRRDLVSEQTICHCVLLPTTVDATGTACCVPAALMSTSTPSPNHGQPCGVSCSHAGLPAGHQRGPSMPWR